MKNTLIDEAVKKLKKEQEHHCNTHIFGKLTKPTMTGIIDSNGDEHVLLETKGKYELLPARKNKK